MDPHIRVLLFEHHLSQLVELEAVAPVLCHSHSDLSENQTSSHGSVRRELELELFSACAFESQTGWSVRYLELMYYDSW